MLIRKVNPPFLSNLKLFKNKQYLVFKPRLLDINISDYGRLNFLQSYNNLPIDLKNNRGYPTRLRRYANYKFILNDFEFDEYRRTIN